MNISIALLVPDEEANVFLFDFLNTTEKIAKNKNILFSYNYFTYYIDGETLFEEGAEKEIVKNDFAFFIPTLGINNAIFAKKITYFKKRLGLYADLIAFFDENFSVKKTLICDSYWGILTGKKGIRRGKTDREAYDECSYSEIEIESVARVAFDYAEKQCLTTLLVDMASMLETSRMWRYSCQQVIQDYDSIPFSYKEIDEIFNQKTIRIDENVVLTSNLFVNLVKNFMKKSCFGMGYECCNDKSFALYNCNINVSEDTNKEIIMSLKLCLEKSFDIHIDEKIWIN